MSQTDALTSVFEREPVSPQGILDSLSNGQCEVLNLLLAGYETNKEIASRLNIAPSTVAQRIGLAAVKLRTTGRGQTKREYERLRKACAFPAYPSQHIPISAENSQQPLWEWPAASTLTLRDAMPLDRNAPWASKAAAPVILEAFVDKLNAASALTVIVGQAVLLGLLAIVVLAILGTFFEFDILRFAT